MIQLSVVNHLKLIMKFLFFFDYALIVNCYQTPMVVWLTSYFIRMDG